ncbi:MAG: type II toxin-antitoxin system RelE family toxin [Emticicia sp.]|uniref:type II toxin-antitoxin system RelE family toxin n=1 Tax=Emticicia sp. TaxID=1930953 RepID=UPI003BA5955A
MYELVIEKRVLKELAKISDPDYFKIREAILALADNPRPNGYIKLKGRNAFRIRQGNYRIIYEIIDKKLLVHVIELGHRKEIYE